MTAQLLLHPKPRPAESVLGYCLRLSWANGLAGMRGLRRFANSKNAKLSILSSHKDSEIADLRGAPPPWLYKQTAWEQGLPVILWLRSHRRWCPHCLQEQGYWPAAWGLTLITACTEHKLLLLERCPSCQNHVSWLAGDLYHCACGQDLRLASAQSAVGAALHSTSLLHAALIDSLPHSNRIETLPSDTVPSGVQALHLGPLCALLWFFGAYLLQPDAIKPQKIPHHADTTVILPLISMAMTILESWPQGFHSFLDRYSSTAQGGSASLRIHLHVLHQALFRLLKQPELHFLQEEFEHYVHTRWGNAFLYAEHLKPQHPMMSATAAAKELGMSVRHLKILVANGELQASGIISPKGRKQLIVDRASVQALRQHKGAEITLQETSKILRLAPARIRLLVQHGLLLPAHPNENVHSKHLAFYSKDLNTFLTSLSHDACPPYAKSTDLISISQVGKQWLRGNDSFIRLMRALINEELTIAGRDPSQAGVRALLLHRLDVKKWFVQLQATQDLLSVPDAARFLQIEDNLLYIFVQAELLKLGELRLYSFGKYIPGITRAALIEFRELYLWGKKLAQVTGVDQHHAATALIQKGVKPVAGPWVHPRCCYVFRMKDITDVTAS